MTEHIIRILKEELEDYIKATYETPFNIEILGVEWKDDTDILEVCYDVDLEESEEFCPDNEMFPGDNNE
jgi:fructose-1-phosphate kinase PfkB-like protein